MPLSRASPESSIHHGSGLLLIGFVIFDGYSNKTLPPFIYQSVNQWFYERFLIRYDREMNVQFGEQNDGFHGGQHFFGPVVLFPLDANDEGHCYAIRLFIRVIKIKIRTMKFSFEFDNAVHGILPISYGSENDLKRRANYRHNVNRPRPFEHHADILMIER